MVGVLKLYTIQKLARMNKISVEKAFLAADMQLASAQVWQFMSDSSATGKSEALDEAKVWANRFKSSAASYLKIEDNLNNKKVASEMLSHFDEFFTIGEKMAKAFWDSREKGNQIMPTFDEQGAKLVELNNKLALLEVKDLNDISESLVHTAAIFMIGVITALLILGIIIIVIAMLLKKQIQGTTNALLNQIKNLTQSGKNGILNARGNLAEISIEFQPITIGVNGILDAVVGPIQEAGNVMEKLSHGDLTLKMQGDYKGDFATLKNSINATIVSMSHTLAEVKTAVFEVDTRAGQVASSSDSLSQGATESAASLEEITSSMNEIGSQTKKNAENSAQAKTLSDEAKQSAELGNEKMKKMVEAMAEINQSSEKISKIIKVIDEIAFQTNLLALNAAVEAARAGKHGKGFAVVAEEVRNLAARSAKAAKETTEMIDDSSKKVTGGTIITQDTAKALAEITSSTTKVTDLVSEISAASNEQAQGISQIVMALGQIDQVTQRNTASAEESASAAEELSGQANQLKSLVGRFKLN